MHATGIDHVNLGFPADRLDEVVGFYVDRLGFTTDFDDPYEAVADDPGLFTVSLGDAIDLFVHPTDEFDPGATNFRHVAVRIPQSPESVRDHLDRNGVDVENTADREHDALGPYRSFYVTDPFGYTVELMAFGE